MYPDVILLNGTGSSGKTSLAKELQELLPTQYLNFSIDSVLYALPPSDLQHMMKGEPITRDGYDYGQLTEGYHQSVKALLTSGCRVIIDNAWINEDEINALENVLTGFHVVRVKVECRLEVCVARELARGDRAIGLAEWEFPQVHKYMKYDLEVDTSDIHPKEAAAQLLKKLS
ncbi:chloramphenicol phosphotransferase CPT family protein [Enterovibrio sp. ZSDZ35]|uniref:Chloramphenicol phosphotransferase CPT family protein n=1 Tax=Enterovibrio qingdaonensis TaxID=2899818 RepID=A0ABT5QRS8_9GAMM|nr:AAA family ATPase [Enterovibrio sp. ZSDZ35]MDD1783604.1 chloramphenicol phosphotransferase CPT family protein [Enterovibrio sp. ZSDZ35]